MKRHAEISIQTLRDSTSQEDSHGTELDALIEQDGVLFFHVFSNVFSNVFSTCFIIFSACFIMFPHLFVCLPQDIPRSPWKLPELTLRGVL